MEAWDRSMDKEDMAKRLKIMGIDIERMLEKRVHLGLWVKVREGWSDDDRALRQLGYDG